MPYTKNTWIDRLVDQDTGEVLQDGTPMNAEHFGHMEDGIETAQATAESAASAATAAQNAANAAQSTADTGVSDAAAAQSTADAAASAAAAAQGTADAAASAAAAAQGTADQAVTNAATAQGTANTAARNASAAQMTANSATLSAATAQNTADAAASTAATAQSTADTALRTPRRNLLDNWDWRNPVNQRGVTWVDENAYCIDRWIIAQGNMTVLPTITTAQGVMQIVFDAVGFGASGVLSCMQQRIEHWQLDGTPMTASVETYDGAMHVAHLTPASGQNVEAAFDNGMGISMGDLSGGVKKIELWSSGARYLLKRVKLEIGDVSTLADDPPMDCGAELLKCRRYYRQYDKCIGTVFYPACVVVNNIDTSDMRVPPTASIGSVVLPGAWNDNVLAVTQGTADNQAVWCTINSAAAMGTGFYVRDITLSADL